MDNKIINTGLKQYNTSYKYTEGVNGQTTTKVKSISNGIDGGTANTIAYTYDDNGNIKSITENGKIIIYDYNSLNELKREDNQVLNKTIVYDYDNGGNIKTKTEYEPCIIGLIGTAVPKKVYSYAYNDLIWKDKLSSYEGQGITYDAIGNPVSYNGYTYAWEAGRQLKSISKNGQTIGYKYNDAGIRTEKTVNEITTKYKLVGDKVTFESNGTDYMYYTYDSEDNLVSVTMNEVEYYYIRNAQGDIIGLIDISGTEVVSYSYDSWGKLLSITGTLKDTVGVKNPYRYRGYRYDSETQLYYLQSRYYNPEWGRFINADGLLGNPGELLSFNMFAYCSNNPVNRVDPSGHSWLGAIAVALGATFTLPAAVATVITYAVVAVAVLTVVAIVDVAIQEYRNHHITYADSSSGSQDKVNDDTSNPISDAMEKRIPNSELNPPKARAEKPTSKKDGKPIEIHHKGQNPNGPFEELSRTDHRLGDNYGKNHPNFRDKSLIDRDKFAKDVKRYWKREWDSGRWNK